MRVAACLAALALMAAIVVSAQTPPPAPAAGTACSLLTKEDAAAALGEACHGPEIDRNAERAVELRVLQDRAFIPCT